MANVALPIFLIVAAMVLNSAPILAHAGPAERTFQAINLTEGSFREEVIGCAAASHRPLRIGMDTRSARQAEALAVAKTCRRDLRRRVNSVAQSLRKAFTDQEKIALVAQWQHDTISNIKLLNDPKQDQMQLGDRISRDFDDLVFDLSW